MPSRRALVVGHGPRDGVQTVRERRRIEDAEADRAVRVVEAGEQRLDVRTDVVVVGGADADAIDEHVNRRAIERNGLGLRRQRPAEVDEADARDAMPPCSGVSMVPNGRVAFALAQVIVRVPSSDQCALRDPARTS